MKCHISTFLILPSLAAASIRCTNAVAIVRQIIVNNNPATASGIAIAIAEDIPACPSPLRTKIIAAATDANAASGATAAPMFAQPKAII